MRVKPFQMAHCEKQLYALTPQTLLEYEISKTYSALGKNGSSCRKRHLTKEQKCSSEKDVVNMRRKTLDESLKHTDTIAIILVPTLFFITTLTYFIIFVSYG